MCGSKFTLLYLEGKSTTIQNLEGAGLSIVLCGSGRQTLDLTRARQALYH